MITGGVNMLTHKDIREEVDWILSAMADSDSRVPTLWSLVSHAMFVFFLAEFMLFISFLVEQVNYPKAFNTSVVLWFMASLFGLFFVAFSMSYRSMYLMIPNSIRNKSRLCNMLRRKVKVYSRVLLFSWFAITMLTCVAYGAGTAIVAIAMIVSMFVAMAVFSLDLSRYQLSAFWGALHTIKNKLHKTSGVNES
jgi:hypothetical protein